MFNYKSPIDIFRTEVEVKMEGEIMKAVQKIAPYVDKDELLKLLKNDRESYETGYDDGYDDGFNANKWIPCSERLPIGKEYLLEIDGLEYYKQMLTTTNDSDYPFCIGWYDRVNETWYDLQGFPFYPIAWMPLPEAYKGE